MFLFQKNNLLQSFNNHFYNVKDITSGQSRKADQNDFYIPLNKIKRSQKSNKFLGDKIWNDIPLNIRILPFKNFKQNCKLYLIQQSAKKTQK